MNIKIQKLIIILILIIILYKVLPEHKLETDLNESNEIIQEEIIENEEDILDIVEELNPTISSRSLEEPRQSEPVFATTYSDKLIQYVKDKEKFKPNAYLVPGETYYTIGYGHHGKDVKSTDTMSEQTAEKLLLAELDSARDFVLKYCDYLGSLTQGELDALVSFTYNGGAGMLQQLTGYKTRNKQEIAEHITAYTNNDMKGLVSRRAEELSMFKGE